MNNNHSTSDSLNWNTLRALMNRIIPADDFPNAWDAGVGNYLARQFERDLKSQLDFYHLGLDALEAEAQAVADKSFAELDNLTQDAILTQLEAGQVKSTWQVDPVTFFHTVIEHVMEGYYSDPGNGGNHDAISWQMIGFERHE